MLLENSQEAECRAVWRFHVFNKTAKSIDLKRMIENK